MIRFYSTWPLWMLVIVPVWSGLNGCTGQWNYPPLSRMVEPRQSPSLSSLFVPDPQDKKYFQTIGKSQDKTLAQCSDEKQCLQAHFLRALTALYESPELASHHFQKVVATEPNNPLAHDSRLWLWLLEGTGANNGAEPEFDQVGKRLVRELVTREIKELEQSNQDPDPPLSEFQQELSGQDMKIKEMSLQIKKLTRQLEAIKNETASIQAVRQELKTRDKKVEELTNQLDALRKIDQELREKAPPTRPSDKILHPPEEEKSANSQ